MVDRQWSYEYRGPATGKEMLRQAVPVLRAVMPVSAISRRWFIEVHVMPIVGIARASECRGFAARVGMLARASGRLAHTANGQPGICAIRYTGQRIDNVLIVAHKLKRQSWNW